MSVPSIARAEYDLDGVGNPFPAVEQIVKGFCWLKAAFLGRKIEIGGLVYRYSLGLVT